MTFSAIPLIIGHCIIIIINSITITSVRIRMINAYVCEIIVMVLMHIAICISVAIAVTLNLGCV